MLQAHSHFSFTLVVNVVNRGLGPQSFEKTGRGGGTGKGECSQEQPSAARGMDTRSDPDQLEQARDEGQTTGHGGFKEFYFYSPRPGEQHQSFQINRRLLKLS